MASKSKGKRVIIMIKSTESHHCYYTQKNKVNTPEKLEIKKYDPVLRKMALYKEKKLPPHS
jgi:large subunit ribosomal protein L33